MRINRYISNCGLCSRREAERWIEAGRVTINGVVLTELGTTVGEGDKVMVDGKPVEPITQHQYWMYHKPRGLMCSRSDDMGRPLIYDRLDLSANVQSVGRLDMDSEGLLVLTDDGELVNTLISPDTKLPRIYRVRLEGKLDVDHIQKLRDGGLDIGRGEFSDPWEFTVDAETMAHTWITVTIHRGRWREVRRTLEALGHTVRRLIRVSFGPLRLHDLPVGEMRTLTNGEILRLTGRVQGPLTPAAGDDKPADDKPTEFRSARPRREESSERGGDKKHYGAERGPARAGQDRRPERGSFGWSGEGGARRDDRAPRPERSDRAGNRERPQRPEGGERRFPPRDDQRANTAWNKEGPRRESTQGRPERAPDRPARPEGGERRFPPRDDQRANTGWNKGARRDEQSVRPARPERSDRSGSSERPQRPQQDRPWSARPARPADGERNFSNRNEAPRHNESRAPGNWEQGPRRSEMSRPEHGQRQDRPWSDRPARPEGGNRFPPRPEGGRPERSGNREGQPWQSKGGGENRYQSRPGQPRNESGRPFDRSGKPSTGPRPEKREERGSAWSGNKGKGRK